MLQIPKVTSTNDSPNDKLWKLRGFAVELYLGDSKLSQRVREAVRLQEANVPPKKQAMLETITAKVVYREQLSLDANAEFFERARRIGAREELWKAKLARKKIASHAARHRTGGELSIQIRWWLRSNITLTREQCLERMEDIEGGGFIHAVDRGAELVKYFKRNGEEAKIKFPTLSTRISKLRKKMQYRCLTPAKAT